MVISPPFFDYYKDIMSAFERLGYASTWLNTWLFDNPIYKLLLRILPRLVSSLSSNEYIRRIEKLELTDVSEVLVVKGEGLSKDFIGHLRKKFPNAQFHLYLWDGIENTPYATDLSSAFDSVSTFDPKDASQFKWRYRPLFARKTDAVSNSAQNICTYDWVFIGSIHSDRYKVLTQLANMKNNFRFFAFGYIPGKFVWWLRHLTNPRLFQASSIRLSTTSIAAKEVNRIIQSSKAVVDIEHPNQRGLTMRSIETLMLGTKLITTNREIRSSDLFHESRVCVIDRNNPKVPPNFLSTPFLPVENEIRSRYYIDTWLTEILDNKDMKSTA